MEQHGMHSAKEFERYFKLLYLPLCMYALRIVGNTDDAEDIVENVFIRAWQSLGEIENFKPFVYRAVRNECISFLRQRRQMESLDSVPEVDDKMVDTSVRDAKIWRAIDELPEKCRQVFLMSKRDGLSNEEIAEELGISINTVKNQMAKAFSRLREALSPGHKPFFLPFL